MKKSAKSRQAHHFEIDHETMAYSPPKTRSAGKITVGPIHDVLPYTGVRNPITTSSVAHKVMLTYRTAANNWQDKVGAAESGAEAAVAREALISPNTYDVEFQPFSFPYEFPSGIVRHHTMDLRVTLRSGIRRSIFVRNATSLRKPSVHAEIEAIFAAIPRRESDQLMIVDADSYSRPRRGNLRRMHRLIAFQSDPLSDQIVEEAINRTRTLWHMSDLKRVVDLSGARIFQSCLRLIAVGKLGANMDAVISQHSRIWRIGDA